MNEEREQRFSNCFKSTYTYMYVYIVLRLLFTLFFFIRFVSYTHILILFLIVSFPFFSFVVVGCCSYLKSIARNHESSWYPLKMRVNLRLQCVLPYVLEREYSEFFSFHPPLV